MNITRLELLSADLEAQKDFYANILELPVRRDSTILEVKAGKTELLFTEAPEFDGAYHFAFNIPQNQFASAKTWISSRLSLLREENGNDEFHSENWNSSSVYFKDAAGNVLEFIARHNLRMQSMETSTATKSSTSARSDCRPRMLWGSLQRYVSGWMFPSFASRQMKLLRLLGMTRGY
jgi:catechol-2,3-dioxygenase